MKTHLIIPDGYNIMRDGTVYSVNRYIHVKNRWGSTTLRYLKAKKIEFWTTKSGYKRVSLGSNFKADVHRLVAEKFIPNPLGLPQVNHKDGNKLNNHADNLEWVSAKDNMKHASSMGLCAGFYGKQKLVPSESLDKEIIAAYTTYGSAKAMAKSGFKDSDRTTISRYIKSRNLPIKLKVNQHDICV